MEPLGAPPREQPGLSAGTPGSRESGFLSLSLPSSSLQTSVEAISHQVKSHSSSEIQTACVKRNLAFLAQRDNRDQDHRGAWWRAEEAMFGVTLEGLGFGGDYHVISI